MFRRTAISVLSSHVLQTINFQVRSLKGFELRVSKVFTFFCLAVFWSGWLPRPSTMHLTASWTETIRYALMLCKILSFRRYFILSWLFFYNKLHTLTISDSICQTQFRNPLLTFQDGGLVVYANPIDGEFADPQLQQLCRNIKCLMATLYNFT